MKQFFIVSGLLFSLPYAVCCQAAQKPRNKMELLAELHLRGKGRPLPPSLLDKLEEAINFAFSQGAAREISGNDLDHAHILFVPGSPISVANPDGILLHTQEFVVYSPGLFCKRNIFIASGGHPRVLPCELGMNRRHLAKAGELFCTVDEADLGMSNPLDVNFANVDSIPAKKLAPFSKNVRVIRGQKILFAGFGFHF